ncbi:MAG: hypothetical protein GX489_09405 [Firmicutes bacterium]|nr:hypothetical protein [Bacillota bacterium]
MKLIDIMQLLDAEMLVAPQDASVSVLAAGAADLVSDILAFVKEKTLLLTGLTNPQVVRAADLLDLAGIVFVRGKTPNREVIEMAQRRQLPTFRTQLNMYEACGILYQAGLRGSWGDQDDANDIH